jgi:hypothetical protein
MADDSRVTGRLRQLTLKDRCGSTDTHESAEIDLMPISDRSDRGTRQAGLTIEDDRDGTTGFDPYSCT